MEILSTSKKCLRYVGLGGERHFSIANVRVSRTTVRCLILGCQLSYGTIFVGMVIKDRHLGLQQILFPLHLIFLTTIKISIYSVLMVKSDRIAQLVGYLQKVVNKSRSIEFSSFPSTITWFPLLFPNMYFTFAFCRMQRIHRFEGHLHETKRQRIKNSGDHFFGIRWSGVFVVRPIDCMLVHYGPVRRSIDRLLGDTTQHEPNVRAASNSQFA